MLKIKTDDKNSSHPHADGQDPIQSNLEGTQKSLQVSRDTAGDTQAALANAHLLMQATGSADPETFLQELETKAAARAAKEDVREQLLFDAMACIHGHLFIGSSSLHETDRISRLGAARE
jgi:hypothetical protein